MYIPKIPHSNAKRFLKNWPQERIVSHKKISNVVKEHFSALISCCNMGVYESYALWKIYTNPNTGVAIKSTVSKLIKALNDEEIKIYKVKYIKSFEDTTYDKEPPFYMSVRNHINIKHINKRVKEVYKLEAYRYENEIRAIYIDYSTLNGKNFQVYLNKLINEMYVSPFAPSWFYELKNST